MLLVAPHLVPAFTPPPANQWVKAPHDALLYCPALPLSKTLQRSRAALSLV